MKALAFLLATILVLVGCGKPAEESSPAAKPESKSSSTMLSPDVHETISTLVRSGFYDKDRVVEIVGEEVYEPGELDPGQLSAAVNTSFAAWGAEKKNWPAVTDCDRIDTAFAALRKRGIIALQNAGYTQSDGYDDFREKYHDSPNKSEVIGYCFYHGQDLERAVRGDGLFVALGPVDAKDEEVKGPEVGKILREELERAGLKVEWDGTFNTRLKIPDLVWQKRSAAEE